MTTKRDAFGILSPYRSHCSLSLFAVYYTGKVEVLLVCQMGINLRELKGQRWVARRKFRNLHQGNSKKENELLEHAMMFLSHSALNIVVIS